MYSSRCGKISSVFVMLTGCCARSSAGDAETIAMLRDAQVTNREAMRHGHARIEVVIAKDGAVSPATVEGSLIWSEGDFLLKYRVSDPAAVRFKRSPSANGPGWNLLLRTRDGVRIYNSKTGATQKRKGGPGAFDPVLELNPWTQLSHCCPPDADPLLGGRAWVEMIGPHPAMQAVAKNSHFEYVTLPGGNIKQTRRDEGGWVNEIVFAIEFDYLPLSLTQFDPGQAIQHEVKYQYRRVAKTIVPVEVQSYSVFDRSAPVMRFTYKYASWDTKPVSRAELWPEEFARDAQGLKQTGAARRAEPERKVTDDMLRTLGEQMRSQGFAKP
jgi:hypothetical protein